MRIKLIDATQMLATQLHRLPPKTSVYDIFVLAHYYEDPKNFTITLKPKENTAKVVTITDATLTHHLHSGDIVIIDQTKEQRARYSFLLDMRIASNVPTVHDLLRQLDLLKLHWDATKKGAKHV
ncbi:MAG: hypothetical protein LLF76_02655 [Planctomycetaceae bacterium]|nr:hypothetical protein [Planctomycetaceae bacterium]